MKRLSIFYDFCKKKTGPLHCTCFRHYHCLSPWHFSTVYHDHAPGCLFATDLAGRGLDFPAVDWVIQYDCPEDPATYPSHPLPPHSHFAHFCSYIHRAGRTARNSATGNCLLLLLPSEVAMVDLLKKAKIPLEETQINPAKLQPIQVMLLLLCYCYCYCYFDVL
jgi:ATP-dependent RNA helicase DDX10/DBP4